MAKREPATYSIEDLLFGTIEFHNGGILWLETSFALNIREQSIMNVSFCGDKAGATLFPAHIYTDNNGELMTLMQREMRRRQPSSAQYGSLYQPRTR